MARSTNSIPGPAAAHRQQAESTSVRFPKFSSLQHDRPIVLVVAPCHPRKRPTLGGNHRYLLSLLDVLSAVEVETVLVCDDESNYEDLYRQLRTRGISPEFAPLCTAPRRASERLDAIIDHLKPSVLHVNGLHGWVEPALGASRRMHTVPRRIYTMHAPLGSLRIPPEAPVPLLERLPGRWAWRQRRGDRRYISRFNAVLSVSFRFGLRLQQSGLIPGDAVRILPNGIDTGSFRPGSTRGSSGSPLRIGTSANLQKVKRLDLLIEAFSRLPQRGRKPPELHVAGEGPERDALIQLADRLGVSDRLRLHGYVADMPGFLRGLDIFALCSDSEAAPYAELEAMATGLPSVVTDAGDLPHYVEDGLDGFVIPRGDVDGLAVRLDALVEDPDLRARMGAAARQLVEREFSLDTWNLRMRDYLAEQVLRASG